MAHMNGIFRLGADAELRYTNGGEPVTTLRLVYNYGQKDQTGRRPGQWIGGQLWGKRAEALAPHLTKGTALYLVLSDPHVETYQTKDGAEGHRFVGRVLELEFAGGNRQEGGQRGESQGGSSATHDATSADFDDDVPF